MSGQPKRMRVPDLRAMKQRGERFAVLTAYDWTMARILDTAGVEVLLVGDSLGMVALGYATTVPVTLDAMIHHSAAVVRGANRALVVADMPFLTYRIDISETLRNAGRLVQEAGVAAVKLEGAGPGVEATRALTVAGIPVMGHLGLTPQTVHQTGGFRAQARTEEEGRRLLEDARALEGAGAFALVLEKIPSDLAARVTAEVGIPTIGIGAGGSCDAQVLVSYDLLGLFQGVIPSFVRQYSNLGEQAIEATRHWAADVRDGRFPAPETGGSDEGPPPGARSGGSG
jgi:3-methyl-2-oxobutanoate hydroxymethyltransferase